MPSIHQATGRPYWSSGRGFATLDPERQGEVLGYVCHTAAESEPAPRKAAPAKPARPAPNWTRVQPDMETSAFEGSSSRRWR